MKETSRYKTVTAAEMKKIEQAADAAGLSYYQMMENAGTAAYDILKDRYPEAEKIIIFAGKGNNAGDGFVLARLASREGKNVYVILVEGLPVTRDAVTNYELIRDLPVKILNLGELENAGILYYETAFNCCNDSGRSAETVIADAIYGTGFHGSLRPDGAKACRWINSAGCPVISLDLPSGTNADTGEAAAGAVRADLTVAFHLPKPVHVSEAAAEYCGIVKVAVIGIR